MEATAKRAGVTRRTVYLHFPVRADLLRACMTTWPRSKG
ncbi:helix-turn-helix transcriptional regulator [Nonomuraea basaltis]|nr:helix-turn-helix transcriptional regulator [Nonomuraea basaltis]